MRCGTQHYRWAIVAHLSSVVVIGGAERLSHHCFFIWHAQEPERRASRDDQCPGNPIVKQKQAGKQVSKKASKAAVVRGGNIIDMLRKSAELSGKKKAKAPPLQPKLKAKARARA